MKKCTLVECAFFLATIQGESVLLLQTVYFMKKLLTFVFFTLIFSSAAQERPKLVVGIVVDQMKTEYLYRFQSDFSENGFKRLMKDGYTFYNMHYNYMPTYTAPGHASSF